MTACPPAVTPGAAAPPTFGGAERRRRWAGRRGDAAVALAYLAAATVHAQGLLRDLANRAPSDNGGDYALFQWMLARAATVVTDGVNPFFTDRLNAPDGVNLMANTSALGLGIPLTPVTLLFGPHVSYLLLLILGLAATAYGWYWVLNRRLGTSRLAAALGGAFCGFAPAMIAHTQGHLNWTSQFLVPLIVDRLFRLRHGERTLRHGMILGVLITYQVFIAEEVLLYVALGGAVFGLAYAASDRARTRRQAGPFLRGLGVALAVALPLLAYPLWMQFFGPRSYQGVPEHATELGNDLAAFLAYARQSWPGRVVDARSLAANATEENTFFGPLLLVLVAAATVWLWRNQVVRAAAVTSLVFLVLSLGPHLVVGGHHTAIPGPWAPIAHLPVFNAVVPSRLALVAVPGLALILAILLDRIRLASAVQARWAGLLAVAAALVPLTPTPLPTRQLPPIPAFAAMNEWEPYQVGGYHIVIVGGPLDYTGMRWAARHGMDLSLVGGLFLGPGSQAGRAQYGAPMRSTTKLLIAAATAAPAPRIGDRQRADARADVRYWHAGAFVLPLSADRADQVGAAVTDLLGDPGAVLDGVRVWDVRAIADGH